MDTTGHMSIYLSILSKYKNDSMNRFLKGNFSKDGHINWNSVSQKN